MGLRRTQGVSREKFREETGEDYVSLVGPEIDRLAAQGLLAKQADRIALTERGLFLSDTVFAELV